MSDKVLQSLYVFTKIRAGKFINFEGTFDNQGIFWNATFHVSLEIGGWL